MTNDAEKLAELFEKFPGIGPRQARRFVYFLLKSGAPYRSGLISAIERLANNIHQCSKCRRYYSGPDATVCTLCNSDARNDEQLLIVEKDADLDVLEKSSAYSGRYFVLGGGVRLSDKENMLPNKSRLLSHIDTSPNLKEIIIAMPITTEGEHTMQIIMSTLQAKAQEKNIALTTLGRGLSTGAELEYADAATLKSALESRT
jgi:recombination protein RecR